MSIHDKYFSKENKNHMYTVLKELILKETSYDIDTNPEYIDFYRFKYRTIFEKIDAEDLVEFNKSLIDEIGNLFINDIKSKYAQQNITIQNKENTNTTINSIESIKKELHINSLKRGNNSVNRYNYSTTLTDDIVKITIKEFMIPDENNILFENPIICIQIIINDDIIDNYLSFHKNITIRNKKYHIYQPTTTLLIPKKDNVIQIKVLNNIKQEILKLSDKIKVHQLKHIEYKNTIYQSLKIDKNNITVNDSIALYCENELIGTFIVSKIVQDYLLIENEMIPHDKTKEYYLLLPSLQNNLLLNCYLS